jgi:Arc/MetJ-type ribon-helix-helix transcriptional regulator
MTRETIVSVRMPRTLVQELRILAAKNHYMDLSEELRSVIREKCLQYIEPYQHELKKIREEIEKEFLTKKTIDNKKQLIQDLKRIVEELKK